MRRREFIAVVGGGLAGWPLVARAQRAKSPVRIGFLFFGSPSNLYDQSLVEAFRQGMGQVGLVEGRDVVLDVVWISGDPDQAVTEVMLRGAGLLVPSGSSASVAASRRAAGLPIVFISVGNPIAMGLVESLSRPGRNATGFSDILADLGGKLVDLARDISEPRATVIDYFWHTAWPDGLNRYQATVQAAQAVGVEFRSVGIADIAEVDDALAAIKQKGARTLIVQPSPFTFQRRAQLIDTAMKYGLATIFAFPIAARDGALIGYGPDYIHMYRKAPLYVDRILKGTKPAELPVEQPTKVQMLVNLKTAKALGFDVPLPVLVRADELVE
jgi:putative tryptophan/tyrosine transport system substrate-binding protein